MKVSFSDPHSDLQRTKCKTIFEVHVFDVAFHTSKSIKADKSSRIDSHKLSVFLQVNEFLQLCLFGCQNYILPFFPAVGHIQGTYRVLILVCS